MTSHKTFCGKVSLLDWHLLKDQIDFLITPSSPSILKT